MTPHIGGGFGHFHAYAPIKIEYAIERFTIETKRLLHVIDTQLGKHRYVAGDEYTIADIACWPWFGALVRNEIYGGAEFLAAHEYASSAIRPRRTGISPDWRRPSAVR